MGTDKRTRIKRPEFSPSPEAMAWAKAEEARGDAEKSNGFKNFSERRWLGFLGEWYFARWLRMLGIPFQRHGGSNTSVDFVVRDRTVGVKCCGANGGFTDNHVVNVYERHRELSPEILYFVGHIGLELPTTILMLGSLAREEYFDQATFIPAGGKLNPVTVAENDVWNLPVGKLRPPPSIPAKENPATGRG